MNFSNEYNALVSALTLAITAPDDDKAAQCVEIAEQIAANLSEIEVERAKRELKRSYFSQLDSSVAKHSIKLSTNLN